MYVRDYVTKMKGHTLQGNWGHPPPGSLCVLLQVGTRVLFPGAAMFEAAIAAGALLLDDRLLLTLALTSATITAPLLLPKSLVRHIRSVACLKLLDASMQHNLAGLRQDTCSASARTLVDCASGQVELQSQSQASGAAWTVYLSAGLSPVHSSLPAATEVCLPPPDSTMV